MKISAFDIIIKVIMLTCVFFMLINYFGYFLGAMYTTSGDVLQNNQKFTSADTPLLSKIGVALTTNIGLRQSQITDTPIVTFGDNIELQSILSNSTHAQDALIGQNMQFIEEYFNILKTDVPEMLGGVRDRGATLDAFIAQLEYRYRVANTTLQSLNNQRLELTRYINDKNIETENLKLKIGNDFNNFDSISTLQNIQDYLDIKSEYTYALTYSVFIGKFISTYEKLNAHNKKLLDSLINNREIIVKNTQVIIPDTGDDLLRDLNLLYSESEWKALQR